MRDFGGKRSLGARKPLNAYDPALAAKIATMLRVSGQGFREKKHFYYVRCPFHGGESLGFWLHKSGMAGKCWKCETKAGYNEYATAAGLPKIPELDGRKDDTYSMGYIQHLLGSDGDEQQEKFGGKLPKGLEPWTGSWRKLRADFLATLGVFLWYDKASRYHRILWPITMGGKLVGYQAGRADPTREYKDTDPKYRASSPMPSGQGFFGLDQLGSRVELLVIVEGAYDCFRLWQAGIPAVALLGSTSLWNETLASVLRGLPRLKYILVATDMDESGEQTYQKILASLGGDEVKIIRVNLPKNGKREYHDPGSAPQEWIRAFRDDVYSLAWNRKFKLRKLG